MKQNKQLTPSSMKEDLPKSAPPLSGRWGVVKCVLIFINAIVMTVCTVLIAIANSKSAVQTKRTNDLQEHLFALQNPPIFKVEHPEHEIKADAGDGETRLKGLAISCEKYGLEKVLSIQTLAILEIKVNGEGGKAIPTNTFYFDMTDDYYDEGKQSQGTHGLLYERLPRRSQGKLCADVTNQIASCGGTCEAEFNDLIVIKYVPVLGGNNSERIVYLKDQVSISEEGFKSIKSKLETSSEQLHLQVKAKPNVENCISYAVRKAKREFDDQTGVSEMPKSIQSYAAKLPPVIVPEGQTVAPAKQQVATNSVPIMPAELTDPFYMLGEHYRLTSVSLTDKSAKSHMTQLTFLFYAASCFSQSKSEKAQTGLDATFASILMARDEGYLDDYFCNWVHPFVDHAPLILQSISANPNIKPYLRAAAADFLKDYDRARQDRANLHKRR